MPVASSGARSPVEAAHLAAPDGDAPGEGGFVGPDVVLALAEVGIDSGAHRAAIERPLVNLIVEAPALALTAHLDLTTDVGGLRQDEQRADVAADIEDDRFGADAFDSVVVMVVHSVASWLQFGNGGRGEAGQACLARGALRRGGHDVPAANRIGKVREGGLVAGGIGGEGVGDESSRTIRFV